LFELQVAAPIDAFSGDCAHDKAISLDSRKAIFRYL
jgi:hypothetical protein